MDDHRSEKPLTKSAHYTRHLTPIICGVRYRYAQGQSTIEYAVMVGVIVASLVVFFSYIRSSVAYRIKVGADAFGHGLLCDGNVGGCR